MKKLLFTVGIVSLFLSCNNFNKTTEWEYRVVTVEPDSTCGVNNFSRLQFTDEEKMLNKMSSNGWEYVDNYTLVETVFPNFGDEQYVTGLNSNTRTSTLKFIFRREKKVSE